VQHLAVAITDKLNRVSTRSTNLTERILFEREAVLSAARLRDAPGKFSAGAGAASFVLDGSSVVKAPFRLQTS
jgi:hypothetical protein